MQRNEAIGEELATSVTSAEPMISPASPSEEKCKTKELSMRAAAHITAGVKELLLFNPP